MSTMCQACWVTPAKVSYRDAKGRLHHRCNTCAEKRTPFKAQSARASLEKKIFNKDTV